VEEPQRGIGGVVERLFVSFREQIRDQAVADVLRERAEQVARLEMSARREREPLEADHRVAPPVGEPVIAGDHAARLVAGGPGSRGVLDAADWCDDELVGGEHELCGRALARGGHRRGDQPPAPLVL
jgi:hypothetical protein